MAWLSLFLLISPSISQRRGNNAKNPDGDVCLFRDGSGSIAVHQALPCYRPVASIRTGVFTIARHKCWNRLKEDGRRREIEEENPGAIQNAVHRDPPPDLGADVQRNWELECLQESLDGLNRRERGLVMSGTEFLRFLCQPPLEGARRTGETDTARPRGCDPLLWHIIRVKNG